MRLMGNRNAWLTPALQTADTPTSAGGAQHFGNSVVDAERYCGCVGVCVLDYLRLK